MRKLLFTKLLGLLVLFFLSIQVTNAQEVIHCWDFNGGGANFNATPLSNTNRATGNGIITHNFVSVGSNLGTSSNACVGSTVGQSFRPSGAAGLANNGKHIDFNFSSEGYENLSLSFWSRRTPTGFDDNQIQYSIDGGLNFTDLSNLNYTPALNPGAILSLDISSEAPLANNQPNLLIRITFNGATNAVGNNRIDNVKLQGEFLYDQTSEVVAPSTQVGVSTVVASNTSTLSVFSFDIEDLGSGDVLSTTVTQMHFVAGANNTVDWSTFSNVVIRDALLTEIPGTVVVSANEVIFTPDSSVSVADGASDNFTVDVTLDQSNIVDESVIQFQVAGINSSFEADLSGSLFSSSFTAGGVVGNNIILNVVATEMAFLQQPTNTRLDEVMQPDLEVSLVDVNGNLDTDNFSLVDISSTGDLEGEPVSVSAEEGVATFSNLIHTRVGSDLELTADADTFFETISTLFNVSNNDRTSEVVVPSTQVGVSTVVASNTGTLSVFSFDIEDLGSGDILPTIVTQMRFVAGANNTVDWSTFSNVAIRDALLIEILGTAISTTNEVIFMPESSIIIADGASDNFTVDVTLDPSNIVDESVIQFQIAGTNSGFEADLSGSSFSSSFTAGDVVGNNITLDVIATEIAFIQQPSDVEVNTFMTPPVQVAYVDENGNVDTSITTDINLTSSGGALVNLLHPVSAVNGAATFPNIAYTAQANGLDLTAETLQGLIVPNSIISPTFSVTIPVIAIQDFDGTPSELLYTTSIPLFNEGWGADFFGIINSDEASPLVSGSFINNIFGENDLNSPNGTTGFASLDFVTVDISGYSTVDLTFDWEVSGYNVSGDRIEFEVVYDGVSQDRLFLFEGGATDVASGTFSLSIPDTVSEVSFKYFIQNNGADGYSGLDNVKLTGDSNARDTQIIAPSIQIAERTIIADINDNLGSSVDVFSFGIVDSGNFDNLSTNITRLRFVPGSLNTANWEDAIQGISISDGTTILDQADQILLITPTEILLDIDADPDNMLVIDDGDAKTYTIRVFLKQSDIIDQSVIQLAIDDGNQDQIASGDGSIFSQDISAFEGISFTIDVVGDGLEFSVQPTTTLVNTDMSPSIKVANTDNNGNLDLSNSGETVSITSTGTLTESLIELIIGTDGYANFNTINHTQPGFDFQLTASSVMFSSMTSTTFDITQKRVLLISEVVDPSDNVDGRYVELFNTDVEALDLSDQNYYLHNPTGTGQSIQLEGVIPPKSYYIISFTDAATFNGIYGINPDFEASIVTASGGQDAYYISFANTEKSLMDVYGVLAESGTIGTTWEFSGARAFRNCPTVREANPLYDATEWTKIFATSGDVTAGIGDNDFVYTGNWTTSGLGDPEATPYDGVNTDKSIFIESAETTLSGTNTISDVVVREGATLILEDAITLNGDFANFGKVIFRSTAFKTAALGLFNHENRRLTGENYEIERYIPKSNRAFRFLSTSVTTTSSIRDNWQEGQNNTQTGDDNNSNLNSGFGTHITGSTSGANGFDATLTGNPSMFEWNAANAQWNSIPNTDTKTFKAGDAYVLLIRGDRSTTLNSNTAVGPATTLRATGKLVVGSKTVTNLSSTLGGFSLIGNPYQAKVNMADLLSSVNSSGVSSQFVYIYDPTLGTRGGYATVTLADGSNTFSIPETSNANQFLEPNQAFFVETTTTNPGVAFKESFKTIATENNTTFKVPEPLTNLNINLFYDGIDTNPVDALRVQFRSGANNAKDTLDATKVWNYDEWFAIDRHPNYMSIETRAMPTKQDSISFYLGNFTRSAYRIELKPENLSSAKGYLHDNYLESSVELTPEVSTSISFDVDKIIPESIATDRFVVKFEQVTLGIEDIVLDSSMVVYPNPVRGNSFSISHQQAFNGLVLSLQLFDLQGRMVLNQELTNSFRITVNLKISLSSGVYVLKLCDAKNSQTTKLIIE
ncbi:T9SS type A sorting domain-containing protein [Psychroflexus sp. MES1-P1E]|uniref:T9SS type A sorting domain-containing protein n=1 Tax=Psychroflexus sp. MES1-P1E TaxID=2058320 RepID=UPI000C7B8920|nr:T9SS type A sorting domain-containing protein [Psychroflexus sp. MES1-P1E]PKG44291.1 hypothetical protein CXF67_00365 [Psychroflexus sp. MES1-P1E]